MRIRAPGTTIVALIAATGAALSCGDSTGGTGPAPTPPPPPPPAQTVVDFAITNVTLVDPVTATTRPDMTVLTRRDGSVQEVGSTGSVTVPPSATVIDGAGQFLSPGLVDVHAHVRTDAIVSSDAERSLGMYLSHGITTILNMGDFEESVLDFRARVESGQLAGPTILAGFQIRGPGDGGLAARIAGSPTEAEVLVDRAASLGYDFIKVYNGLSPATFNTISSRSRSRGLDVVGHAVRSVGLPGMFDSGALMVAHAEEYVWSFFGGTLDEGQIPQAVSMTAAASAYVTATLSTFETVTEVWGGNQAGFDQVVRRPGVEFLTTDRLGQWEIQFRQVYGTGTLGALDPVLEFQRTLLRAMHEAGVRLLLGTDSPIILGMVPGFSMQEEIRVLMESGFTEAEILRMGTTNAAALIEDLKPLRTPTGAIAPEAMADLVLLDTNPLTDLTAFGRPSGVMARGRWFGAAELDALRMGVTP